MGTNTGIGIGIGIPFKNNALGGDRPYLPPELKARLIGVWDNYGKKNTDADRNIIKNKIPNAGGDLEILNSAYKLNSGFGKYREDFTSWRVSKEPMTVEKTDSQVHISYIGTSYKTLPMFEYTNPEVINDYTLTVEITGIPNDCIGKFIHVNTYTQKVTNGINTIKFQNDAGWFGFTFYREDNSIIGDCNITIKQIPEYEGAFVTDGVNDMIISQKTLQEMGVTKDFTIVSMIHQITLRGATAAALTNYIRQPIGYEYVRNYVANIGKTGIYGYVVYDVNHSSASNSHIINTILGDKNDYSIHITGNLSQGKFSVQGYINGEDNIVEISRVAHYWTFALLGKATEDDINLIIGYFNLDRTLKADIYCNIERQGITNDNHAEFGDKLIDYSGNGRNIQLNNISWNKESGINDDGALCLDGVIDYGKAVGLPIYKDYTFIIDREILSIDNIGIIASKSESAEDATKHGAFIFEYLTAPNVINTWSYYKNNTNIANTDFTRGISYQSKYNYNGKILTIGTSEDSDKLYLGTIRDNSDKYGNIAIYFLMSFPYSMNKFLIERQLKKYKAGTLYKDMVEFRPVIKSNIDVKNIVYLDKDSNVVKVGDYISIGSNIKTSITVLDGYKISKASSTAFNNITIEKSNTDFIYDVIFYGIKKSPQKINLVIEQDSDYVQWNPNIKANVSKYSVTANIRKTDGTILKLVNGQFYSTSITGNLVLDIVPSYKDSDEVTNVVIDGKSYVPTKDSSGNYYRLEIPLVFPKEINITIQEYVRYEDIVQPYPVLLRFKDENNNEISWGDKIKLGSSITRIGSFNDCNLLKDIYTVSNAKLNGNPLPSTPHVVERQMIFTCTATWIFDDNEPNCILSPRLLHAPNSSYKILGHIPDISGHGNHGVIHNSAYKLNSGANGYLVDFTTFRDYGNKGIVRTDSKIYLDESFDYDKGFWLGYTNSPSPTYKVRVSGIPKDGVLNYTGGSWINLINGINELPARTNTKEIHGFVAQTPNVDWSNLVIEQIGEYEGAYCLDGINDFVTIPSLITKQSLIKCNWTTQNYNKFLVDYRKDNASNGYSTNKTGSTDKQLAYNGRVTYIDGILNKHIIPDDLKEITHNIIVQYPNNIESETTIACSYDSRDYMTMALWDYISFPEISTEDKIKELSTYIGITPKVTLPNYYWDNYGKKNTDAKRGYIDEQVSLQKTGTSVNPLENFNIGYEGMSGYNGYPVVLGTNKTWETSNAVDYIYDINSTIVHITNVKHAANGLLYSYVKKDGALANIKEIPAFRVTVKGLEENSKLIYKYLATENATKESIVYLGNGIHKLPKSFVPTDALLDLTTNSWIGFAITSMIEGELVFDCDITIEILPEYENGLAYDGVSDFTDNKNIPIFTDFTAIIKRVDLDAKNDNSTVMFKGNKIYESGIGNGFILDYCYNSKNYVYSYGKLNQIERDDSKIIYLTPESYNGNPIIKGENEDNLGLALGKYWKGIIYKTILYSKTISLLEINFLKNLMEKDEIIDINHPIFISNTEDESNTSQDS